MISALPSLDFTALAALDAVTVVPLIDSTNTALLQNADTLPFFEPHHAAQCLIAREQTAGRGRNARAWHAPADSALLMSLGFQTTLPLAALSKLGLWAGLAVAQTLHALGIDAKIKWPNDIYVGDAKIAGLLIETKPSLYGTACVIGVGLNWSASPQIDRKTTCIHAILSTAAHNIGNNSDFEKQFLPRLLGALNQSIALCHSQSATELVHAFAFFDYLLGKTVQSTHAQTGEVLLQGVAAGLSKNGGLLLRVGEALHEIHSGEVSVRITNI